MVGPRSQPARDDARTRLRDRLAGLLVLETIALGIALASPLVPSRTGSHWSPADLVTADPTYPQEVIASFVAVNLLLAALGVVVVMVRRWAEPTSPDEPEP